MTQTFPDDVLHDFQQTFTGDIIRPTDDTYDTVRALWNGRYNRRPALIVRPAHAADVARAVQFAQQQQVPLAVRCGGHSAKGESMVDDGLTIDLALLKDITVDPQTNSIEVGGGASTRELMHAAQQYGLAVPTGTLSVVGFGGLATGGGFGMLMRKYGLTIDNIRAVEIVTADGQIRTANASENPDLFWAVRGGGGNFGIVTRFTVQAHPIGTMVLGGPLVYTLDTAAAALRHCREVAAHAPDEWTLWPTFTVVPPMEPFPEHLHGQMVLMVDSCYVGDLDAGARVVQPLREGAPIAFDMLGPLPYEVRATMLDGLAHHGLHHDVTSRFLHELSDAAIDTLVEHMRTATTPLLAIQVVPLGGAVARVANDATAFGYRDAPYMLWAPIAWAPNDDAAAHVAWMNDLIAALEPFSIDGAYVNVVGDEGAVGVQRAYPAATLARLRAIKQQYDPTNLFCNNQNIPPAG